MMNTPYTIIGRNVNHTLPIAVNLFNDKNSYRIIAPRGLVTRELTGPAITTYLNPLERVLFDPVRDANPFFHLFESLWILAGRNDIEWLSYFLPRITEYSDDGLVAHGAYGWRMRNPIDQIKKACVEFRRDPDSRRVIIGLWQPGRDSGYSGRDMPCNCTVAFKIREGRLNMTVFNRSNDMVWGAYGANVVQFSYLLEYVAAQLNIPVGVYSQFSDSFHVYEDQDAWKAIRSMDLIAVDPYEEWREDLVEPFPLVTDASSFDDELKIFMDTTEMCNQFRRDISVSEHFTNLFFRQVAVPMYNALRAVRNKNWDSALEWIAECEASDWRLAGIKWIARRGERDAHQNGVIGGNDRTTSGNVGQP